MRLLLVLVFALAGAPGCRDSAAATPSPPIMNGSPEPTPIEPTPLGVPPPVDANPDAILPLPPIPDASVPLDAQSIPK